LDNAAEYVETPEEVLELPGQPEQQQAFSATVISRQGETVMFEMVIPPKQGEMALDREWLLERLEERQDKQQVTIIGELPEQKMVVGMWVDGLLEVLRREFPERYVTWLRPMATRGAPAEMEFDLSELAKLPVEGIAEGER